MAGARHARPRRSAVGSGSRPRPGKHRRPTQPHGRRLVAVAVVPMVLAGGSAAYAYWSASGSGSATLASATAAAITVTGTPSAQLYPGSKASVSVTLGNPNPYPVRMTTLTALTVTSSNETACPVSHITVLPAVATGVSGSGYVLPSPVDVLSQASSSVALTDLLTMATGAPDECQSKTFTVSMTFTGSQV